ncbi:MAG: glycosyltransferase [Ignavibacterium sp.]|nr:glycosyltransferase [Ignavibacterium sp.]
MKVLVLHSITDYKVIRPYINEQIKGLEKLGVTFSHLPIDQKGINGYLRILLKLKKILKSENYDLIHAHYGLIGTLASMQRKVPVVITFHGSDINISKNRFLSLPGILLSRKNIFVSNQLVIKKFISKSITIPCGIDLNIFYPIPKNVARKALGFNNNVKLVLFTSHFDNPVKNYHLAKKAISLLKNVELIELKNYSREQVNLLMNACDCLLLTSKYEGSPQVVKEAMACNCPIVATKVGDVPEILSSTNNCFIVDFEPLEIASAVNYITSKNVRSNGRDLIQHLDNKIISLKIFNVYKLICN